MTLVKFNPKPNHELMPGFTDAFNSIFNDTFFNEGNVARVPATNICESKDHYHIELAAPGLEKEDFKLHLEKNLLRISVEKTLRNEDRNYSKKEFSYTSFVREFTLPETADYDSIDARYVNGLLTIDIAKKEEAKTMTRQIEIQ